jgi:hypothetical protein
LKTRPYNYENYEGLNILNNSTVEYLAKTKPKPNPDFTVEELSLALCKSLSDLDVQKTKELLDLGADRFFQNGTCFYIVAENPRIIENSHLLELLLKDGIDQFNPYHLNAAIKLAVINDNQEVFNGLIDHADLSIKQGEIISLIAYQNNTEMMKTVLEKHPNIDLKEPLCSACEAGSIDMIDLIAPKVNKEEIGQEPLERGAFFHENQAVYHLVNNHDFKINDQDNSFLITAITTNNSELLKFGIDNSTNPAKIVSDQTIMNHLTLNDSDLLDNVISNMSNSTRTTNLQPASQQHTKNSNYER